MRLAKLDYLQNKRISIIQKSRRPLQLEIQMIHNRAVDNRIFDLLDDPEQEYSTQKPYDEDYLLKTIGELNLRATNADIRRLLSNSIVSEDDISRLQAINAARATADQLTKVEVERISKNLEYIEETVKRDEAELSVYKKLIKNNPIESRKKLLEEAIDEGKSPVDGRIYSYKELDRLSENLERYKTHKLEYEQAINDNNTLERLGRDPIHTKKTWVWSKLEHTRHHKMEGQTVDLYEKFTVTNEINGDVDYMSFPGDIENGTCSNTCNCGCTYKIE